MGAKILGISAFYHDSAAALLDDGKIVFAAQEERFTRKKHDSSFPVGAIKASFDYAKNNDNGLSFTDLDAVVFYEKPLLKFERLLETYYAFAPRGVKQFISAMPLWIKEKLFFKELIYSELRKIGPIDKKKTKLLFSEHHLSHAASAFYPSCFEDAAILTIDGVGEWATASLSHGSGKGIKILRELRFPHSIGLLYSAFTYYLGFKVNSGEYKLMGLAPYGNPDSGRFKKIKELIYSHMIDVKDDGSLWLNQDYFSYCYALKMLDESKWERLFGFPAREPETDIKQEYCDMALAVQHITEDAVLKMAAEAKRLTGSKNLCMAGGVALNCVANGKLLRANIFDDIWVQPASGDAGGALGAALAAHHIYFGKSKDIKGTADKMQGSYLGPEYSDFDIETMASRYNAVYERHEGDSLYDKVAKLLDEGFVVGWCQDRMEWGPRALGNRSILADARDPRMQKRLNLKIKYREGFRPFAPSVLYEDADEYFDDGRPSPYMLSIAYVKNSKRKPLPEGYNSMPLMDKLYYQRSDIPAVTHLDFSARVQTVHKETNPKYRKLLEAFKRATGCGLLVNTSFNVRGEPVVCTPEDAYRCFMNTEMDYLVISDFIFDKKKLIKVNSIEKHYRQD